MQADRKANALTSQELDCRGCFISFVQLRAKLREELFKSTDYVRCTTQVTALFCRRNAPGSMLAMPLWQLLIGHVSPKRSPTKEFHDLPPSSRVVLNNVWGAGAFCA